MELRSQRISKLSENALPGITSDVGAPASGSQYCRDHKSGLCRQELLFIQSTFPTWFQTGSALVPDTLPEEHCKQILITRVAAHGGERHILLLGQPIFQLRSPTPPPPALSEKHTGGPASHRSGLPTFKAQSGGAPLALVASPCVLQVTASDSSLPHRS